MASLIVAGNTSGTVTLQAPDVSGSTVLTLPTTSGTIVTTGGGASVPFAAGSAASPSITCTGDTNTGIFSPGADTIGFSEGGVESMRLDSSGNLLVGSTSSYAGKNQSWGAVTANAATPNFAAIDTTAVASGVGGELAFIGQFQSGEYAYFGSMRGIKENGTSGNTACALTFSTRPTATAPQERMRIDSSGNVGIGTSSPSAPLDVQANTSALGIRVRGRASGDGGNIAFFSNNNATEQLSIFSSSGENAFFGTGSRIMSFSTNSTERMRISPSGVVGIGQDASAFGQLAVRFDATTSPNNSLGIGVSPAANTSNAVYVRFYNATGNGCGDISRSGTSNAVVYGTTSDYRLKENVQPMTGALAKVSQLKPVTYRWIDSQEQAEGFIAHELQAVIPTAVVGEKDATQIQSYEVSPAVPATYDEEGNELTPAVEAVMGEREVPKYQNMDTSFLVATLTAAIQEQQAIIQSQASTITAMEARLTALENK
jgi:hypothetical protein